MHHRATVACVLGMVLAAVGCTSEDAGTAPTSTPAPSSSSAGDDPTLVACADYADSAGAPRVVLDQADLQPVLGPGVALLLLDVRDVALSGSVVPGEAGAAFTEVLEAVDEVAAQLDAGVPEGSLAGETPVALETARLRTALTTLDATCSALGVTPSTTTPAAPPTS